MTGNDDHRDPQPPRVPAFLLRTLPLLHRSDILGDLSEGFRSHVSCGMAPRLAARWFWKTLGSAIAASVITRWRYRLRGNQDMPASQEHPGRSRHPLSGFRSDIRFALRGLAKNPGFAISAVFMLALGIGVNAAAFGMHAGMAGVVQRFHRPDELAVVRGVADGRDRFSVSGRDFMEWSTQADAFREMGVYQQVTRYVTGDREPRRIGVVQLSANLFPLLGLNAELGRLNSVADEAASAPAVAVLTHRFWEEQFGGDAGVLGRTIVLNDVPFSIIGVLPAKAEFEVLWRDAAVFTPLILRPGEASWGKPAYRVIGRLADDASMEQAQAQMSAVAARLAEAYPETNAERGVRVVPFAESFYSPDDRLVMGSLLLAAFALLLIACVNLASFLLAKGTARQGEVAIRLAVGASRGRIVRQLLTESLLLSGLAGAAGIVLGNWGLKLLLSSMPDVPFLPEEVGLNPVLLAYTSGISVAAALAFGLTPALLVSRVSLSESIKESGGGTSAGRGRRRFRRGILVAQLALTVPLVLSCVVGFRQVQTLANLDFGFPTGRLLVAQADLPAYRFSETAARTGFIDAVVAEVRSLPGVTAAAAGLTVPIGVGSFSMNRMPLLVEGRETAEGMARGPQGYQVVTPEFFSTLGVRLRRGRFLTPADGPGDAVVAVVNEAAVRRYWPDQDPVGRRLIPDTTEADRGSETSLDSITVVGVVADLGATFYGDPPEPAVYLSHLQDPPYSMMLVVRTADDPLALAPALRVAVNRVDPGVPLSQIRSGEAMVDDWLQESRTVATMLGILGMLALGMAVVGLYGMVAYSVAQRTFELGLRMVLGANRGAICRTVMQSFVTLAGVGLLIGLVISAIGALVMRSQLVMLRIPFVSTVAGLVVLLGAVVLLASYLPARRATSLEPVQALRSE